MPKLRKMFFPTAEAIRAVEPEPLIDVLITLRENGFIKDFYVRPVLTEVHTSRKDQFDLFSMLDEDFQSLLEPKLNKKPL